MATAPNRTPAPTVSVGSSGARHVPVEEPSRLNRADSARSTSTSTVTPISANAPVPAFQGNPTAPKGMMASPTTPNVSTGPTASATGQLSRPASATNIPG